MYIIYIIIHQPLKEQVFVAKLHTLQCMYVYIVVALCALNDESILYL